jgi:hypothetical protein
MKKELPNKRLSKLFAVTPETHLKAHKRKLDRKMPDIDALINHLLEVEKEVNKRK